jgi:hypothetical protein
MKRGHTIPMISDGEGESQKAQIFAALCKWRPGGDAKTRKTIEGESTNVSCDTLPAVSPSLTRAQAAQAANVSVETMQRAMTVDRNGDESLKLVIQMV